MPEILAVTSAEAIKSPERCALNMNISSDQKTEQRPGSSLNAVGCLKYVEDFEILETLGQGFFGIAYKVREKLASNDTSDCSPVLVMKEPLVQPSQNRWSAKKIVSDEYYMLRLLKHPNILKTRGICVQQQGSEWKLNLLVDFCDSGSLQQLIVHTTQLFDWHQRCQTALDICKAMEFVHKKGFMHRDLTSMNILLQSQYRQPFPKAVVADFGLSCRIPQKGEVKQQVGTQNWMAPEMLMEKFYDEKADVFSFGIICCQMIARLDADHDAGLYRTPMFGLDYVRFTAHCPSDTPLSLLKTAFLCSLWNSESRPSFNNLCAQLRNILHHDLPKWPDLNASADDPRIGRSHSDAAIRSPPFAGMRRFLCEEKSIPEGVSVSSLEPVTPDEENTMLSAEDLDKRIKQLATSVANEDPDYQVSTMNPFSKHDRYRSMRKIKPGDLAFIQNIKPINPLSNEPIVDELDEDSRSQHSLRRKERKKSIQRCRSLPQLSFQLAPDQVLPDCSPPLLKLSKRSFTLGLGEQRDLQGRITMTFRDYDRKFTKSTSKSGILQSVNDLQAGSSAESLTKNLFLMDIEKRKNEQNMHKEWAESSSCSSTNSPTIRRLERAEELRRRAVEEDVDVDEIETRPDPLPISPLPSKSGSLVFSESAPAHKSRSPKKRFQRLSENSSSPCSLM